MSPSPPCQTRQWFLRAEHLFHPWVEVNHRIHALCLYRGFPQHFSPPPSPPGIFCRKPVHVAYAIFPPPPAIQPCAPPPLYLGSRVHSLKIFNSGLFSLPALNAPWRPTPPTSSPPMESGLLGWTKPSAFLRFLFLFHSPLSLNPLFCLLLRDLSQRNLSRFPGISLHPTGGIPFPGLGCLVWPTKCSA